ncbi:hypothetical protein [Streptomyces radiopugnans]|uniref:hypothetical protein n=1 Tax=Streptomyces radiopugnans TaxID=403935 RepID=UPI003F1C9D61
MAALKMSAKKAAYWNQRFEQAHREGPEAFARVWLDLVKISALQKARRTRDPAVWNTLSAELERIYRNHCA